ncbi:MAG: DNA-directed RNA polymerase subunit alpha [Mycoplasmataceae bacterium RC_NB112A]|nr:MAG: DNA-directed RNA polymerase subunit alpha [Mycoplasmataceae bacterium RC_NB112A]KLL01928.1 MAG: DNA-directed RNA polymerase subunit alpha [Mycoplasmataceae bacterium RC_NB112A]
MASLFNSLKVQEIPDKNNPQCSSFVFQDLPLQMGTSLGNFLRQILLNHLSEIAPLAVEISDQNGPVKSKFSILSSVAENGITSYLILKLKEIILVETGSVEKTDSTEKKKTEEFILLHLNLENKTKKERIITAADFKVPAQVEIKNPELELASLSPGGKLTLKLYCQKNWGYHSEEEQKKILPSSENVIVLDTDYSPLKGSRVSFQVEPILFQKKEKLTLNIQSQGWITPAEAFFKTLEITNQLFPQIAEELSKKIKKSAKKANQTESK